MPIRYERDYEWSVLKSGKRGKRLHFRLNAYCPINTCELCGRRDGERWVHNRSDVFSWNFKGPRDWTTKPITMLCGACWNKVRAIVNLKREAEEIGFLARKLLREVANGNKNRRDAGVADGCDRGGESRKA
jgi:hypothetical protein